MSTKILKKKKTNTFIKTSICLDPYFLEMSLFNRALKRLLARVVLLFFSFREDSICILVYGF